MSKGKFIVFEGSDGSGQTTQAELLRNYLQKEGRSVILTKEPTKDSEAGRKLSDVLNHRIQPTPLAIQELFNEDRRHHLEHLVLPSIKEGRIVISDRYFFSSMAYGPEGYDFKSANQDFPLPDLTIILDISSKECLKRIVSRGKLVQLYETELKLKKVIENYRVIAKNFENTHLINGERPIEVIHQEILELVMKIL